MPDLKQEAHVKYSVTNQAGVAHISLVGGFGWWEINSDDFTRQVDSLINSGIKDVFLYINSPGGDMIEANEVINQVKRFTGKKTGKLGALCASSATQVSSELDYVEAAPNVNYFLHEPSVRPQITRPADWESNKKLYDNLRNNAITVYVNKTGQKRETIESMMTKETWLNAKEALELGFIDAISGEEDRLPSDASTLRNYARIPQFLNKLINLNEGSEQPDNTINNEEKRMKLLAIEMGLKEDASEAEFIAAYKKIKNDALKAEGATENSVKVLVSMAEKKGFKKDHIEKFAKADFNGALNMVQEAPELNAIKAEGLAPEGSAAAAPVKISDIQEVVNNALNSGSTTTPSKKFSEMTKPEKAEMLNKAPAKLQAAFKAEYGTEPTVDDLKARYL